MRKLFFVIVGLILTSFIPGDELTFINSIKVNSDFFTTDPLGNIYVVQGADIQKYSSNGELIQTFSDKSRGNIFSLDASNPLKILVFYKDFRQIIFLSSNMTVNGDPILLDELNIAQAQLACSSYDNNFWVYDHQNMNLMCYDKNLQITAQSNNISLVYDFGKITAKPNYIEEQSGKVYLNFPGTGILEFDKFGTYSKTIPVDTLSSFQPYDDALWYLKNDTLNKYVFKSFDTKYLKLPDLKIVKARVNGSKLYIQLINEIRIYSTSLEKNE